MRLTQFTDNALRCLIFLAVAPTRTATVQQVSAGMRMSPSHLLKVIRRLVELRYVRTIRGRRGGVQLATSAASITVAAVVRATEDNLTLVPCFAPGFTDCPIMATCLLAPALDESLRAFFGVLERYTIADLASGHDLAWMTGPRGSLRVGQSLPICQEFSG